MVADSEFSGPIRWAFVEALYDKPNAETNLKKIFEDTRISLQARKKALYKYITTTKWDVMPLIRETLRVQQPELEMLYEVILNIERALNFERSLDPSSARDLIPDLKKLKAKKGLHPKIHEMIDATLKAIEQLPAE